ncbi:Uncharacterized protein NV38_0003403 [Leptospira kirschneri serovar Mozdok]|nr:Uncharacterized protein NV38_0003403 [Leptospira kirschneri serovar Mozdok]
MIFFRQYLLKKTNKMPRDYSKILKENNPVIIQNYRITY